MEENPNCAATYASFRLFGPDIHPDAITRVLGISPTFQVAVGDITPKGTRPRTEGIWSISTKGLLQSTNLEAHIAVLLDRLPTDLRDHVPAGSRCEIACYWLSATGQGGPTLSSAVLARLGAAGIALDFDLYFDA